MENMGNPRKMIHKWCVVLHMLEGTLNSTQFHDVTLGSNI